VCFVGRKFEFLEEIMICGADDVLDISGEIDALVKYGSKRIEQRFVSREIDVGILRLRQQPGAFFQRQVLTPAGAECHESVVRRFAAEKIDDFLHAPAKQCLVAQSIGSKPVDYRSAEG